MPAFIAGALALVRGFSLSALIPGAGLVTGGLNLVTAVVNFFRTPVGRWVGVALIAIAVFVAGDIRGRRAEAAKYETRLAQMKDEAAQSYATNKADAERDANARVAAAKKQNDDLQKRLNDYESALSRNANDACKLSPDGMRRLRAL